MKFTYRELRIEAERELKLRQRAYPGKVARKRMGLGQARRYIELQQAIIQTLCELEKTEYLLPTP